MRRTGMDDRGAFLISRRRRRKGYVRQMCIDGQLLDGFAVSIDGVPVPEEKWTRRGAAALVQLLALSPARDCTVTASMRRGLSSRSTLRILGFTRPPTSPGAH